MNFIKDIASSLISPIANIFAKKQERKKATELAHAKIAKAKVDGEHQITMTDAEWEALSVQSQSGSWKDEYVTLIITLPIVGILAGSVYQAFTGDNRLLRGVNEGIKALSETGVDMGYLMTIVVMAAVGLKVWRAK